MKLFGYKWSHGLLIARGNANIEIAGILQNMSSIGYLNDGKKDLEQAIKLKPMAMGSMVEASLAVSTYYAPCWPLSYGDEDEAIEMIIEALKQDPNSMELLA